MLVAMRLGMRVALAIVRLLLRRVRRAQTGLVIRLALGLSLRVILARSVRRRRTWPDTGQESLEIGGGGHFCRYAVVTGDLRRWDPSFAELSEALFREGESMRLEITKARKDDKIANQR